MALELDFSKLNNITRAEKNGAEKGLHKTVQAPQEANKGKSTAPEIKVPRKPIEGLQKPTEHIAGQSFIERKKEQLAKAQNVYKHYTEQRRKAEEAQAKILQGIYSGVPVYDLLLTAVDCIGALTNDEPYSEKVKTGLVSVHGMGFQEKRPLEWELQRMDDQLNKLRRALALADEEGDFRRISKAIQKISARKEKLIALLKDN